MLIFKTQKPRAEKSQPDHTTKIHHNQNRVDYKHDVYLYLAQD